jgi:predicted membrane protein (TIGR00267 family)
MFNQKSRVDTARQAYLSRDKRLANEVHQKQKIHKSIHKEKHTTNFNLPEIILGGQDGLVNVLGIILGVAAATADARIVIVAGLAATFAESVSMAAVAYTSKLAEADYYQSEYEREKWEIENMPQGEKEEIKALYENYGFSGKTLEEIIDRITANKKVWLKVMMEQELKLEPIERDRVLSMAILVGISAVIGSLIPLFAFFFLPVKLAIYFSLFLTSLTLFFVGYYKAKNTLGRNLLRQGLEMMIVGMVSALVGYLVGSLFKI